MNYVRLMYVLQWQEAGSHSRVLRPQGFLKLDLWITVDPEVERNLWLYMVTLGPLEQSIPNRVALNTRAVVSKLLKLNTWNQMSAKFCFFSGSCEWECVPFFNLNFWWWSVVFGIPWSMDCVTQCLPLSQVFSGCCHLSFLIRTLAILG